MKFVFLLVATCVAMFILSITAIEFLIHQYDLGAFEAIGVLIASVCSIAVLMVPAMEEGRLRNEILFFLKIVAGAFVLVGSVSAISRAFDINLSEAFGHILITAIVVSSAVSFIRYYRSGDK